MIHKQCTPIKKISSADTKIKKTSKNKPWIKKGTFYLRIIEGHLPPYASIVAPALIYQKNELSRNSVQQNKEQRYSDQQVISVVINRLPHFTHGGSVLYLHASPLNIHKKAVKYEELGNFSLLYLQRITA